MNTQNIKEEIENFDFNNKSIHDILDICTKIETIEDAQRLLERYRAFEPQYADQNLGYILGYIEPPSLREKMYKLFPVNHPVFGSNFGRNNQENPKR